MNGDQSYLKQKIQKDISRFLYYFKKAPRLRNLKLERKLHVGILGIYLADVKNTVKHLIKRFNESKFFCVKQYWVHLGAGKPEKKIEDYVKAIIVEKTPKVIILNQILNQLDLWRFDYILICDDDIVLPKGFLDVFILLTKEFDFVLSQRARTKNSWIDHEIVCVDNTAHARSTRFVEIGPLFCVNRKIFEYVFPFDPISEMGWGLDFIWPALIEKLGLKMGIVDAVPLDHSLRRPGQGYKTKVARQQMELLLQKYPHLAPKDAQVVLRKHYSNMLFLK